MHIHSVKVISKGRIKEILTLLFEGDDIAFENIKWSRHARGVLRCGISNIRFSNIEILREDDKWCLSSSGGGPQVDK